MDNNTKLIIHQTDKYCRSQRTTANGVKFRGTSIHLKCAYLKKFNKEIYYSNTEDGENFTQNGHI